MANIERMKIAVSINGEGRGHVTRMMALCRRLRTRYEFGFWCPDSIRQEVAVAFPDARIYPVPSLRFVMNGAEINYLATMAANLAGVLSSGTIVSTLAGELAEFRAEAVLSDFEPFLPEAARRLGLPVLQFNHPGIITKMSSSEPDALIAKLVASRMMGCFDKLVISSFYNGDVGPVIRPEILRARRMARRGNYILVYAKDEFKDRLASALAGIPGPRVRLFPNPAEDFPSALAGCRAVVAPSGHQLAAEALCLRKPIFVIPQTGQYEQRLNGEMLRRSGRGDWAPASAFEDPLRKFLSELETYPRVPEPGMKFRFRDDGKRAAAIVDAFFLESAGRAKMRRAYNRVTWPLGRLVPSLARF